MVEPEIMATGSITAAALVALAPARPIVKSRSAIIIIKAMAATSIISSRTTVTVPGLDHVRHQLMIKISIAAEPVELVGAIEGTGQRAATGRETETETGIETEAEIRRSIIEAHQTLRAATMIGTRTIGTRGRRTRRSLCPRLCPESK